MGSIKDIETTAQALAGASPGLREQVGVVMDYVQSRSLVVNMDEQCDLTWESVFTLCKGINALLRERLQPAAAAEDASSEGVDK